MNVGKTTAGSKAATIAALALIAISVWFRIWHVANIPGLNGDEAEYGAKAIDLLHGRAITWVTSNGSHQNLLYFLPIVALHAVFAPSVTVLRSVAVICGIGALVANCTLCRRILGGKLAMMTTLLLAVLPENIAQSRIGWDPCQTLLIDCFTVYFSLGMTTNGIAGRKYLPWAVVCGVIGATIHAPNVFVLVFPIVAALIVWQEPVVTFARTIKGKAAIGGIVAVAAIGIALAVHFAPHLFATASVLRTKPCPPWPLNFARLFSGATTYAYYAGWPLDGFHASPTDILALLPWVFTLLWSASVIKGWKSASQVDKVIAIGWLAEVLVFTLAMTSVAMIVGVERYALCLVLPSVLAFSRACLAVAERVPSTQQTGATLAGFALLAGMLWQFNERYFGHIMRTGGTYAPEFMTGPIDPKQAAWQIIRPQLDPAAKNYVYADSWWTYQPLRYFAAPNANVVVVSQVPRDPALFNGFLREVASGHVWLVAFRSDDPTSYRLSLPRLGIPCTISTTYGYNHVPLVDVVHPLGATRK